jgi:hypothetical protein
MTVSTTDRRDIAAAMGPLTGNIPIRETVDA